MCLFWVWPRGFVYKFDAAEANVTARAVVKE